MSRKKGTAVFAVNFEPSGQMPLDARLLVADMNELIATETYASNNYYIGMPVIVIKGNSGKTELWVLKDTTKINLEEGWQRLDADEATINDAIAAMDLTDKAVDGEFITTVSQSDGKVKIDRGKVDSDKVTAVAVAAGTDTVAIDGITAAAQIKSLGKTLKTVQDNAAKYEVEKVTTNLPTNVEARYQVVSYVGDSATATKTKVGEYIDIPKDGQLKNVEVTKNAKDEPTVVKFTYILGDGSAEKVVEVDLGKAIFESEIGNGLQTDSATGVISVKKDATSETFLTVSADGVKLAGVQEAINTAVAGKNVSAEGDNYITATASDNKVSVKADVQPLTVTKEGEVSTITGVENSLVDGANVASKVTDFTNARIAEEIAKLDATVGEATVALGKHVAVQVVETDGKITAVNVKEDGIASSSGLQSEIDRAKAAEDKIEASVGLAADGSFTTLTGKHYINGATTVMNAVEKLDAKLFEVVDDDVIDCGVYVADPTPSE